MNTIGSKIKALRNANRMTQSELAEILSVSPQSVSKWENDLSVPDIMILPLIARYFGITMDELFGYRLDSLSYKERFIRFMCDNGMLRFGEFNLNCDRISPYYIHSGYNNSSSQMAKLGQFYAECIKEHFIESHLLIGNTTRQIPLIIATSLCLFNKYGIDMNYCIDFSVNGLENSGEMTLITDTFTTGNALMKLLETIKAKFGKYPTHIIIAVDRMEQAVETNMSGKEIIEKKFGVKIHSIVNLDDIITTMENGIIAGYENLQKMKDYRDKYKR